MRTRAHRTLRASAIVTATVAVIFGLSSAPASAETYAIDLQNVPTTVEVGARVALTAQITPESNYGYISIYGTDVNGRVVPRPAGEALQKAPVNGAATFTLTPEVLGPTKLSAFGDDPSGRTLADYDTTTVVLTPSEVEIAAVPPAQRGSTVAVHLRAFVPRAARVQVECAPVDGTASSTFSGQNIVDGEWTFDCPVTDRAATEYYVKAWTIGNKWEDSITKEIRFPVVGQVLPEQPGGDGGAGSLSGVGIADLAGNLVEVAGQR
ncbi:hypothetical protein [Williamsia sp. 1138]|uniref:hypothetical protein n=1 Tax=Williamsia sp. 1138 TaxID=1903117 RepID=UPI001FEF3963|nr:hypothetical protein [Williamsia sp. 1138]